MKFLSRLLLRQDRHAARPFLRNEEARREWLEKTLKNIPQGASILDVGAGEAQYKGFCTHLDYVAQDVATYDGKGNGAGLQTGDWDFSKIDLVCDILDIPEDRQFDALMCTEVLEHIPDAVRALEKFSKIVAPGGQLIITAPFGCITHFAPQFFSSGYSEYFYRHHLERLGFSEIEISFNGSYFRLVHQEMNRSIAIAQTYTRENVSFLDKWRINRAMRALRKIIVAEERSSMHAPPSTELAAFGLHVLARKTRN
jgi:SAM-dependent methyltransferase